MPEFTIALSINISVEDGRVSFTSATVAASDDAAPVDLMASESAASDGGLSQPVVRMVEERSPRTESARYRRFLVRCVEELGARPATPNTGDRPYVNINPPAGVRGARLGALTLTSGRLAFHGMSPELADNWPDAEPVSVNGKPTYVRIYLRGDEQLEQGMSMLRTLLEER
ncbi:MAG: hypothetical protein M3381_05120 [Actinomycetota bacterium]|nr:hypothetical protein [Actinomycetota bacterium]